jgi:hypothetical protein
LVGISTDSIFDYTHFHSNPHEVLGIAKGAVTLVLGGETGRRFRLKAGDMLILPAGIGYRRVGGDDGLKVVGAYPRGLAHLDMKPERSNALGVMRTVSKNLCLTGEGEVELRAASGFRFDPDPALVTLNDTLTDCQAQASSCIAVAWRRENNSKIFSLNSGSMPMPLSRTVRIQYPSSWPAPICTAGSRASLLYADQTLESCRK